MVRVAHSPRRIVINHELLGRLRAESPRADWLQITERAGLVSGLADADIPAVSELVRHVVALPPTGGGGEVGCWFAFFQPLALGLAICGAPVFSCLSVYFFLCSIEDALPLIPVWFAGVVALAIGVRFADRPGRRTPPVSAAAMEAFAALQALRSTAVVGVYGGAIVENTPHFHWFAGRFEELAGVERQLTTKIEEMVSTARRIEEVNRRLGREGDDPEIESLRRGIAEAERGRLQVSAVRSRLDERGVAYEAQLDELRVRAERRALSMQVDRLTMGEGDASARAAAAVEVDVLELEVEIGALIQKTRDEEARMRAVLEVAGASR